MSISIEIKRIDTPGEESIAVVKKTGQAAEPHQSGPGGQARGTTITYYPLGTRFWIDNSTGTYTIVPVVPLTDS